MAISAAGSVESMCREKVQKNIDGLCLFSRRRRKENGAEKHAEMKTRFGMWKAARVDNVYNLKNKKKMIKGQKWCPNKYN